MLLFSIMRTRAVYVFVLGCVLVMITLFCIGFVHLGVNSKGKYSNYLYRSNMLIQMILMSNYTSNISSLSFLSHKNNFTDSKSSIISESALMHTSSQITSHSNDKQNCLVNKGSSNENIVLDKHRHIVIIRAMSFIGSRMAMYFHERGYHVLAVEDLECVDNNDLKWYRWTQLMKSRIPIQVIMLSRKDKLKSLLATYSPQAIIYVPTKVNGIERIDHQVSSVLRNYVSLLMNLKNQKRGGPNFVLVSHAISNIEEGWLKAYETLLSFLYSRKKSSLVKVTNVHGPWQDYTIVNSNTNQWYIDDVGSIVQEALTSSNQFLWDMDQCNRFTFTDTNTVISVSRGSIDITNKWIVNYNEYMSNGRNRNASLGAYLVHVSYVSQYGRFPVSNRFRYFFEWFKTAMNHGLSIVIFHDTLTNKFQSRLKAYYHKTDTVLVRPVSHMIANDQRFYFIYNYLLKSDDIHMAITTDIRDVEFLRDPAETMSLLGSQYTFTGLDEPYFINVASHGQANSFKKCYPSYPRREVYESHGLFNNGVLGGTRSTLLTLLIHMLLSMEVSTHIANSCCDMPTIELLMHTKFFKEAFVGYPFNSAFFTQTPGPPGLTVRHKPNW